MVRLELLGKVVGVHTMRHRHIDVDVFWPWTLLFTAEALEEGICGRS